MEKKKESHTTAVNLLTGHAEIMGHVNIVKIIDFIKIKNNTILLKIN